MDSSSMRILFIPDFRYWITGVIAEQIIRHNPEIDGLICSVSVLQELLHRNPDLPDHLDLVHFLVPVAGRRYLSFFQDKLPCVSTIHHIEPGYVPEAIPINLRADATMVVAEMWRKKLEQMGASPERIIKVPNGVDTRVFRPLPESERRELRQHFGFGPDEQVIGFCGKPARDRGYRKGVDIWIKGLKRLAEENNQLTAAIGGPGWEEFLPELHAAGIKVYWRGFQPNLEDGASLYQAMDFYWVTSRIEGAPVPLLEAMSSGICCLSTKVGIAPEIIVNGENGYLVSMEDADQFANLTTHLINNPEQKKHMESRARQAVAGNYDWSKTAVNAKTLYQIAIDHFNRRMYLGNSTDASQKRTGIEGKRYLNIPASLHKILSNAEMKWLDDHEQLAWLGELCRMGERRLAFRLGWRVCMANIRQMGTWHLMVKMFLPNGVLNQLKKIKNNINI